MLRGGCCGCFLLDSFFCFMRLVRLAELRVPPGRSASLPMYLCNPLLTELPAGRGELLAQVHGDRGERLLRTRARWRQARCGLQLSGCKGMCGTALLNHGFGEVGLFEMQL